MISSLSVSHLIATFFGEFFSNCELAAACPALLWELPDIMSASEGGGVSLKSGCRKGYCMNLILHIRSQCGQGGSENPKILRASYLEGPLLRWSQLRGAAVSEPDAAHRVRRYFNKCVRGGERANHRGIYRMTHGDCCQLMRRLRQETQKMSQN